MRQTSAKNSAVDAEGHQCRNLICKRKLPVLQSIRCTSTLAQNQALPSHACSSSASFTSSISCSSFAATNSIVQVVACTGLHLWVSEAFNFHNLVSNAREHVGFATASQSQCMQPKISLCEGCLMAAYPLQVSADNAIEDTKVRRQREKGLWEWQSGQRVLQTISLITALQRLEMIRRLEKRKVTVTLLHCERLKRGIPALRFCIFVAAFHTPLSSPRRCSNPSSLPPYLPPSCRGICGWCCHGSVR